MFRSAWRALTSRGRLFLLIGVVVLTAALAWGQRDLARLGLLFLLLPIGAVLVLSRVRLRIDGRRELPVNRLPLGQRADVSLRLERRGISPVGLLRFEDAVPAQLGLSPRFAAQRLVGSWTRTIRFPVRGLARGRFELGPLTVQACDPFGLARSTGEVAGTTEVVVTPAVYPLPPIEGVMGAGVGGESAPQHVGRFGPDDVLVREYRAGDDVRRVHWRSTARWDQLMVRREEQALEPTATILLDNRQNRHVGTGRTGSFEWSVSAAASICDHFAAAGFRLSLLDAAGRLVRAGQANPEVTRTRTLLALTDEQTTTMTSLAAGVQTLLSDRGGDVVVAVLAGLDAGDVEELTRARRSTVQGLALVIDAGSFSDGTVVTSGLERPIEQLRAHRWRVVRVRQGTSVEAAWRGLADRTARDRTAHEGTGHDGTGR